MNSTLRPRLPFAAAPFSLSVEAPPSSPPCLCVRALPRLPRPDRGVSAFDFSFFFRPFERPQKRLLSTAYPLIPPLYCPTKPYRISVHFARFWSHLSPFRMNTYKSLSKQRTLSAFRITIFEKQGRGYPVRNPTKGFCPACPDLVGEEHHDDVCESRSGRDDRRFRPCRKGSLPVFQRLPERERSDSRIFMKEPCAAA